MADFQASRTRYRSIVADSGRWDGFAFRRRQGWSLCGDDRRIGVLQGLQDQLAVLRSLGTGMQQVIQIINHPGLPHVPRRRLHRDKTLTNLS